MKLFQRRRAVEKPRIPPGRRVYAVGDVHGRLDLLDGMLDRIDADLARHPNGVSTLIFLGDYVDRGPASASVLDRLIEVRKTYRAICLKGNHEAMMRGVLEDAAALPDWGPLGGVATLLSYGLQPMMNPTPEQSAALSAQLRQALPSAHLAFLDGLPLFHAIGDYLFVHAGLRPKLALERQTEQDLLWIREDFTLYEGRHEKFVVHGHTPVMAPDIRPNRINIDTGAYATGRLTCLVLEDAEHRFL